MSNSVPPAGNGVLSNDVTGTATPAPASASTDADNGDATQGKTGATPDTSNPDANLPKRLRGKSEQERIEVYRNLESELGRKNNEVGQLRYAIDQMLRMQAAAAEGGSSKANKAKEDEPVTGERLLTDPAGTIEAVAERVAGKSSKEVQERLDRIEFERRKESFEARFPKYQETMADEDFLDWVKASPLRGRLAAEAAQRGSFDAAEELFGLYEEVRQVKEARVTSSDTKKPNAADGKVLRPGNGNTTGGAAKRTTSAANSSAPTFKRSELTKLYMTDRDAYNSMGAAIRAAYASGRVTND